MKRKIAVVMTMALLLLAIVPACLAQIETESVLDAKVRVVGHFTTNFDYQNSGVDHRCFINLHAKQLGDEWTGQGVFYDTDYQDGKLVAIFTIETATYEGLPRQVNYRGTADVYVNDVYVDSYICDTITAIGEPIEVFSFQIPQVYYAFVFETDIGLNMNVK